MISSVSLLMTLAQDLLSGTFWQGTEPSSVTVKKTGRNPITVQDGYYCVVKVVDGDTINILPQLVQADAVCTDYDEHKVFEEKVSLRFNGVNTTECGKSGNSREEKCDAYGEPGSEGARLFTKSLVGFGPVALDFHETDSYGRAVTIIRVKDSKTNTWIDVNRALIAGGYGFPYFIEEDLFYTDYVQALGEAWQNHTGLWASDDWRNRPVILTSYHPERKGNEEYARVQNISPNNLSTKQYAFEYQETQYPILDDNQNPISIPPGRTLRVFPAFGTDQLDPTKGSLDVYLGLEQDMWDGEEPLLLRDKGSDGTQNKCVWAKVTRADLWSAVPRDCPRPAGVAKGKAE